MFDSSSLSAVNSELNSEISGIKGSLHILYKGAMGDDANIPSKNFNDYTETGIYSNGGTNFGFSNCPLSIPDNGILIVLGNHQLWFGAYQSNAIRHRRRSDTTWTSWENIGT